MKILVISHKPPYPPKDGGSLAMFNLITGLQSNGAEVDVLCIETDKHPFIKSKELNIPFTIQSTYVNTNLNWLDALMALSKNESYNLNRFYSTEFQNAIIDKLRHNSYDIVQLESLFVTPYLAAIKQNCKAKIVLRSHNIEHNIWEQLSAETRGLLKKGYLKILATQLKTHEKECLKLYDAVIPISKSDEKVYRSYKFKKSILTIPFSIDISRYDSEKEPNNDLYHIGSMDWLPNLKGVQWFLKNVFPHISNTTLHLAGKSMPKNLLEANIKNVKVAGEVPDAIDFMQQHGIMIAPLFTGSGMRVKIIEAMALGKVVIATPIALKGIEAKHENNVLIAKSKNDFIDCINRVQTDSELRSTISTNAKKLIVEKFDLTEQSKELISFYKNQLL